MKKRWKIEDVEMKLSIDERKNKPINRWKNEWMMEHMNDDGTYEWWWNIIWMMMEHMNDDEWWNRLMMMNDGIDEWWGMMD